MHSDLKERVWFNGNVYFQSSGISFDFWRETVATLVAEKKLSPDCIFHYLSPEDLTLARTS